MMKASSLSCHSPPDMTSSLTTLKNSGRSLNIRRWRKHQTHRHNNNNNKPEPPWQKKTTRLFRTDGKRPDGLKHVLWQRLERQVIVLGRNCHESTGWILRHWVRPRGRCCSGARRFSQRRKICQHWKRLPLCTHRGRNLGPDEHFGLPTLSILEEKYPQTSGDDRERAFLLQRISVLVQLYNAVLLHDTLPAPDCTDWWPVPNFVLSSNL